MVSGNQGAAKIYVKPFYGLTRKLLIVETSETVDRCFLPVSCIMMIITISYLYICIRVIYILQVTSLICVNLPYGLGPFLRCILHAFCILLVHFSHQQGEYYASSLIHLMTL